MKLLLKKIPSYSIITGKSCGCGTQSPANLKFRLAEAQMKETQEMYFRNGKLEEAIMEVLFGGKNPIIVAF